MNLYLVQHAEAMQEDEDPARPLTSHGMECIRKVAHYASRHLNIDIERIVHSGKKRAIQTAEVLSEELKPAKGMEQGQEMNPLSGPWGWVEQLSQTEENLMLVGHLPHLKRLASLLLCQDESKQFLEFQQGGIISFSRNESGIWVLRWMIIPEILPGMR
jgi:phosphohistidine phosphatase